MLDTMDRPSECSDCARYRKEIARLKNAIIETDLESVRRSKAMAQANDQVYSLLKLKKGDNLK